MIYKDESKDENLGIVVAVEGYAQRHNMREKDVFALLQKHEVNKMLRSACVCSTFQALEESIEYVEDVLSWKLK
jgi:hypothetical protein